MDKTVASTDFVLKKCFRTFWRIFIAVKKQKSMRYLIIAVFYKDVNDKEPIYRVPVNVKEFPNYDFVNIFGLTGYGETSGYFDFRKELKLGEIFDWTDEEYEDELIMVLSHLDGTEKIQIRLIESAGSSSVTLTEMKLVDTIVRFSGTRLLSKVEFEDIKEKNRRFHIPLRSLKKYFKVLTLFEVIERLKIFGTGQYWSTEDFKDYFESGIDEAISLASEVFHGKRDLDGNPDILHSLAVGMAGQNKNEKIVGFLHDVVEDTDITFNDLDNMGFSTEVIEALKLLTHDKKLTSYETYIKGIIRSGNHTAINVKINDLRNNITRGESGHHMRLVKKHKDALTLILESQE